MRSNGTSIVGLAVFAAVIAALAAPAAEARGGKPKLIRAHLKPGYVGAPGYAGGPPGPRVPMLVDPGHGFLIGLGVPATIQAALK